MPLSRIWLNLGEYDELYYLTHFIFGLRPKVMRGVYIQHPESLLVAKNMAEKLELTHLMTSEHQEHTRKKKTNKAAQHRDTQERRSGRRHFSQIKHRVSEEDLQYQISEAEDQIHNAAGCISAHRGALEVSCPEVHG